MYSTRDHSRRAKRRPSADGRGAETRRSILTAAAELIGELGWGRVRTRAIAQRAGVPLGAVSYHFNDKRALLRAAAAEAVSELFATPTELARSSSSLSQLLAGTSAWYASGGVSDPSAALLMEAMREAVHDPWLRRRIATALREYRGALAELVAAEQKRGELPADMSDVGVATVIAALLDGLLLHLILDPDVDGQTAQTTLERLLFGEPAGEQLARRR